jgi:hypothetical protein
VSTNVRQNDRKFYLFDFLPTLRALFASQAIIGRTFESSLGNPFRDVIKCGSVLDGSGNWVGDEMCQSLLHFSSLGMKLGVGEARGRRLDLSRFAELAGELIGAHVSLFIARALIELGADETRAGSELTNSRRAIKHIVASELSVMPRVSAEHPQNLIESWADSILFLIVGSFGAPTT